MVERRFADTLATQFEGTVEGGLAGGPVVYEEVDRERLSHGSPRCACSARIRSGSKILTVLSKEALARRLPSGLKATL